MNIILTGGAGFIGSHFCDFLVANDQVQKITVVDKFTYAGLKENLEMACRSPKVDIIEADICDVEKFLDPIVGSDIIFNMAAESHVDNSISSPEEFIRTNVFGTFSLLEAVRKYKKNIRFVQISTDEVYGSLTFEDRSSLPEDPLRPSSPYSSSKAGADLLALSYVKTYGLDILITRSSNNFGPRQSPEKLIPKMIANLLKGESLPVYGKGLNARDWLFVEDNCRGVWEASQRGKTGEIYHLGAGSELTNLHLVEKLIQLMDGSTNSIEFVKDRPGHDIRYSLNIEKTQKQLDWEPSVNHFDQDLMRTIDWYRNNKDWLSAAQQKLNSRGLM